MSKLLVHPALGGSWTC